MKKIKKKIKYNRPTLPALDRTALLPFTCNSKVSTMPIFQILHESEKKMQFCLREHEVKQTNKRIAKPKKPAMY